MKSSRFSSWFTMESYQFSIQKMICFIEQLERIKSRLQREVKRERGATSRDDPRTSMLYSECSQFLLEN